MDKNLRSWVWLSGLFKKDPIDKFKVTCTVQGCSKPDINRKKQGQKAGTSNLISHANIHHPTEAKAAKDLHDKKEQEKNAKKRFRTEDTETVKVYDVKRQKTLQQTWSSAAPWDINDEKSKEYHYLIAEWIAVDCRPFTTAEDVGFVRIMNKAVPKYTIPGRDYFTTKIMPDIYERVQNKVKILAKSANNMSLTTDIWKSKHSEESFISLTGHILSTDFEHHTVVLRSQHFPDCHTALNITTMINKALIMYEIPKHKIHFICSDNAANMTSSLNTIGVTHLPCFLHTLQLVINKSIFEQPGVNSLLIKCKTIVTYYKKSPEAKEKYRNIQIDLGMDQHKLIQDIAIRWNSTFNMLVRMVQDKDALVLFLSNATKLDVTIRADEWTKMANLVKILGKFDEITNILSYRQANSSEILGNVEGLKLYMEQNWMSNFVNLRQTVNEIKAQMKQYFQRFEDNTALICATFLDPRYKLRWWQKKPSDSQYNIESITDLLFEAYSTHGHLCPRNEIDAVSAPAPNEVRTEEEGVNMFDGFSNRGALGEQSFNEFLTSQFPQSQPIRQTQVTEKQLITNEVSRYLEIPENEKLNPYVWWRSNKALYPKLAILANKFLCSPPSSVESERLFSIGGNIITAKRNRLKPENGEMLMSLAHNLKHLGFEY